MATLERNNESTKEIHKFLSKQGRRRRPGEQVAAVDEREEDWKAEAHETKSLVTRAKCKWNKMMWQNICDYPFAIVFRLANRATPSTSG